VRHRQCCTQPRCIRPRADIGQRGARPGHAGLWRAVSALITVSVPATIVALISSSQTTAVVTTAVRALHGAPHNDTDAPHPPSLTNQAISKKSTTSALSSMCTIGLVAGLPGPERSLAVAR